MPATVAERLDAEIDAGFMTSSVPAASLDLPDLTAKVRSRTRSSEGVASRQQIDAEVRRLAQGPSATQRARKLGVLLAMLEGVSFAEAAELLDQKPQRLADMLHGRTPVPGSLQKRLDALAEVVANLHQVLDPGAIPRWLDVDAPNLRGGSPRQAIKRGRMDDVLRLVRSYVDPSFV